MAQIRLGAAHTQRLDYVTQDLKCQRTNRPCGMLARCFTPDSPKTLMDLDKRKSLALDILQIAAAEVPGTPASRKFRGLIEGNQHELALRILEEAGEDHPVSRGYWSQLMQAAETLGFRQLRLEFGRRHRRSTDHAQ